MCNCKLHSVPQAVEDSGSVLCKPQYSTHFCMSYDALISNLSDDFYARSLTSTLQKCLHCFTDEDTEDDIGSNKSVEKKAAINNCRKWKGERFVRSDCFIFGMHQ